MAQNGAQSNVGSFKSESEFFGIESKSACPFLLNNEHSQGTL